MITSLCWLVLLMVLSRLLQSYKRQTESAWPHNIMRPRNLRAVRLVEQLKSLSQTCTAVPKTVLAVIETQVVWIQRVVR